MTIDSDARSPSPSSDLGDPSEDPSSSPKSDSYPAAYGGESEMTMGFVASLPSFAIGPDELLGGSILCTESESLLDSGVGESEMMIGLVASSPCFDCGPELSWVGFPD